ncbi:hypothetical protein BH11CYA1_BH11CYA1_05680 [soil metagenome]
MTIYACDTLVDEVWREFQEKVKDDDDAADAIYQSLIESDSSSCGCPFSHINRDKGARFYSCHTCKKDFWLTSGSVLSGVVRLRAWLAAIFFKDHGVAISAARLSRLVGVASSTALNIHKKIALVVCEQMAEAESVSAGWFSRVIFKRSRQTPADCHPRSELDEIQNSLCEPQLHSISSAVEEYAAASAKVKLAVSQFIGLIGYEFHGISKKCLQLYLASFWCTFDRGYWTPGSLLSSCLRHGPISYEQILNFVTPARVLIMLPVP